MSCDPVSRGSRGYTKNARNKRDVAMFSGIRNAPFIIGTNQKDTSQTGSNLAREAPRHACWHLPRWRLSAASGGGDKQLIFEPIRASFEPVGDLLFCVLSGALFRPSTFARWCLSSCLHQDEMISEANELNNDAKANVCASFGHHLCEGR